MIASSKEEKNIKFYELCHNSKFPFISMSFKNLDLWVLHYPTSTKIDLKFVQVTNFLFAFVVENVI